MKKNLIINFSLILIYIICFFIPYKSDGFLNISLFNHSSQIIVFICIYIAVCTAFLLTIFLKSNIIYNIINSICVLGMFSLFLYSFLLNLKFTPEFFPSWSFYLSLLVLLAWIVYLLYPRFLKKHVDALKLKHTRKPTKAEQIIDLQRQIDELKKTQDESIDISSDNEKGSD